MKRLLLALVVACLVLGVTPVASAATLSRSASLTVSSSSVTVGTTVTLSGVVNRVNSATRVRVQVRTPGSSTWVTYQTKVPSTSTRKWSTTYRTTRSGTHYFRALVAAQRITSRTTWAAAVSPTRSVVSRTLRKVTLVASPGTAANGQQVSFSGRLTPSPKGSLVRLQRKVSGVWVDVGAAGTTTTLDSTGTFALDLVPPPDGTHAYRAYAPPTATGTSAASAERTVVTEPAFALFFAGPQPGPRNVEIRGYLRSGPGQVAIQRLAGGAWQTVATVATTTSLEPGIGYRFAVELLLPAGDHGFRATVPGTTIRSETFTTTLLAPQATYDNDVELISPLDSGGRFVEERYADVQLSGDGARAAVLTETGEVLLRDNQNGTRTPVATAFGGGAVDGVATEVDLSADGCHVTWVSDATNLTGTVLSPAARVYARNVCTSAATELVSIAVAGTPTTGGSSSPSISADGCEVAFVHQGDAFVRHRASGTCAGPARTELVSSTTNGSPAGGVGAAVLSGDGGWVAFTSTSGALHPQASVVGPNHVYLRALGGGAVQVVTRDDTAGSPVLTDPFAGRIALSGDGRYVAFSSSSGALALTVGKPAVARFDRNAGSVGVVSAVPAGVTVTGVVDGLAISADGTRVTWSQEARLPGESEQPSPDPSLPPYDPARPVAFSRVLPGGASDFAVRNILGDVALGEPAAGSLHDLSADGTVTAFGSGDLYLVDHPTFAGDSDGADFLHRRPSP